MIKEIRLKNFRSFKEFGLSVGNGAYLMGPNNAGKSTILTALRLVDVLIRQAHRRNPILVVHDGGRKLPAWPMSLGDFPALRDSVRHEFSAEEARLEISWKDGARLVGVWSEEVNDEDGERTPPYFYLERLSGMPVRNPTQAREAFDLLGVIPILTPVEHSERQLDDRYVRTNISGRLSSRHFRNQLRLLEVDGQFEDFISFAEPWLDGLAIERPTHHSGEDGLMVDVFYQETNSRVPKELVWAGDGIQVWLQILYHIFRVQEYSTIVLDEPEVYLHPDLQRRLVHLLEATGRQILVATHSSEVASEADPRLIALVDKTHKRVRRAKDEATLEWLSSSLGTAFNLRLARALRSRVVLFVEGKDMLVIKRFAKVLGLPCLEKEQAITIIRLEGFSGSSNVTPFAWLCGEMLPDALKTFVFLDRDYRSDSAIDEIEKSFNSKGIVCHVWRLKELESYLLTPSVIARITGLSSADAQRILDRVTLNMGSDVFARLLGERINFEQGPQRNMVNITSEFKEEFDIDWSDPKYRLSVAPAKDVISKMNDELQRLGLRALSTRSLASAHHSREIDAEMVDALRMVNSAAI